MSETIDGQYTDVSLTESEDQLALSETPESGDLSDENPVSEDDQIDPEAELAALLDDLNEVTVEGETPKAGDKEAEQPAPTKVNQKTAKATAEAVAGGLGWALIEFGGYPVTEEVGKKFAQKLTPILENSNATVPPFVAEFMKKYGDWFELAGFIGMTGYQLHKQRNLLRQGVDIKIPTELKQRIRVPKEVTSKPVEEAA